MTQVAPIREAQATMPVRRLRVWDPWVRLVHWSFLLLIPFSYWTATTERWELHIPAGYVMLTLLLFRLAWGIVGSDTARFGNFLRSPLAALRHLAHLRRRDQPLEIGHNAAGGWMVLLLLLLLLTQATTGLFADDEILTRGPLAAMVDQAGSAFATFLHLRVFWVIVAAAVLHVLAVLAYRLLRGDNLVRPMLTGWLDLPAGQAAVPPRLGHPLLALLLLAAAAACVWGIAQFGD